MVINHIENHTHAPFMNFRYQLLEFCNAFCRICRISWIHACQSKVALRIIAPVIIGITWTIVQHAFAGFAFIGKIIAHNWQQLHMGHAKRFEVIQFVDKGSKGTELLAELPWDGRVWCKITHMSFIDNGVFTAGKALNGRKSLILLTNRCYINNCSLSHFIGIPFVRQVTIPSC